MIISAAVTIVVDGAILSSFAPARIVRGRIAAPLAPVVVRLVSRAAYSPGSPSLTVERGGRRVVVPVLFVEQDVPYVELARVVRGIGGSTAFDNITKTLAISLPPEPVIATPAPFEPGIPAVAPTAVFTPPPRPEPSREIDRGIPRPRRTAIPAIPSQPVGPSPAGDSTRGPRR